MEIDPTAALSEFRDSVDRLIGKDREDGGGGGSEISSTLSSLGGDHRHAPRRDRRGRGPRQGYTANKAGDVRPGRARHGADRPHPTDADDAVVPRRSHREGIGRLAPAQLEPRREDADQRRRGVEQGRPRRRRREREERASQVPGVNVRPRGSLRGPVGHRVPDRDDWDRARGQGERPSAERPDVRRSRHADTCSERGGEPGPRRGRRRRRPARGIRFEADGVAGVVHRADGEDRGGDGRSPPSHEGGHAGHRAEGRVRPEGSVGTARGGDGGGGGRQVERRRVRKIATLAFESARRGVYGSLASKVTPNQELLSERP
ncbi:hypothetical protein THAOC_13421 [Thalassiosira oceanica]|uniref:Uncharacterized protein n=1 Tax=Thalassiosira oceanica TaxID=159749 RepID=K0SXK0_THAOC|nr:hypothetical protein THAOC_13421 [Thalassiosira oceanica]|eukprot:EJK65696.1 hypothetical protein THAOC_13421 [Thalassiosira oceanica]